MEFRFRALGVGLAFLILVALCAGLYFGEYVPLAKWNSGAIETRCEVTGYSPREVACPSSDGGGGGEGERKRATDCSEGFVQLQHPAGMGYVAVVGIGISSEVDRSLKTNYPIGMVLDCLYESDNPADIRLSRGHPMLIMGFVVGCAAAAVIGPVLWVVGELVCRHRRRSRTGLL